MTMPNEITRRKAMAGIATGLATGLAGCGSDGAPAPVTRPVPDGAVTSLSGRTLGLIGTEPQRGDYEDTVLPRLKALKADCTALSVYWDESETAPGAFAPEPNFPAIADLVFPPRGLALSWAFPVIDTTNRRLPPDLSDRPFDDPELIARFKALMEWTREQMPSVQLTALSIGNEVDAYLDANPDEWPAWRRFLSETAPHARRLWPGVPVGCKVTAPAVTQPDVLEMNRSADGVFLTYYPVGNDFAVAPPSQVARDFARFAALPDRMPVHILECGLPSSAALGSSEDSQADFITEVFAAWDTHRDVIRQIDLFALHDFDPALVETLKDYYGIDDPRFAAFLGTLGLRTFPGRGTDKAAWARLVEEVERRR